MNFWSVQRMELFSPVPILGRTKNFVCPYIIVFGWAFKPCSQRLALDPCFPSTREEADSPLRWPRGLVHIFFL